AHDESLFAGCVEVRARAGIGPETLLVGLVRREIVECDQAPADVVRAFVRKKIADQMPAAARNHVAPSRRVFGERVALVWIDLVADHADESRPRVRTGSAVAGGAERDGGAGSGDAVDEFTAGRRHAILSEAGLGA